MILLVFVHHAYDDDNDCYHYDGSQDTEHHSCSHTQPVRRGRMIGILFTASNRWCSINLVGSMASCMK